MEKNLIENIARSFSKLPGMGPRIAKRILLHLASNKEKTLIPLLENLQELLTKVHICKTCGNLDEGDVCGICLSENRNKSLICIVEEVADLWAIERTKNYNGLYHVLGGNLSAISGKTIEDLNLKTLETRLNREVAEVIIATSATIDGQTTAHFLAEILKDYKVKVTRLAHGIPIGSELDYLDDGTISIAFKTRLEF